MSVTVAAYCTHRHPPAIDFPHENYRARRHDDPQLGEHLNGRIDEILDSGRREMTATLYAVMRHLQRTQVQCLFDVEGENIEAIASWAWQANAILKMPDRSFRDPAGAVLVDSDTGLPEDRAQIPFLPDARQRKSQSELLLRNRLIDVPESLPPVVSEHEVILRAADDVAWRAIALFVVAVRAESVASGNPIAARRLKEKSPHAFEAFTPSEREFVHNDEPDQQSVINFAWRYETLFVLQWALGLQPQLPFADEICDVPLVAQTMMEHSSQDLINEAQLRPVDEILAALDFNFRALWAAREAARQSHSPPAGIDGGVLVERQHALNWLTQFENADWDDVDVPT